MLSKSLFDIIKWDMSSRLGILKGVDTHKHLVFKSAIYSFQIVTIVWKSNRVFFETYWITELFLDMYILKKFQIKGSRTSLYSRLYNIQILINIMVKMRHFRGSFSCIRGSPLLSIQVIIYSNLNFIFCCFCFFLLLFLVFFCFQNI